MTFEYSEATPHVQQQQLQEEGHSNLVNESFGRGPYKYPPADPKYIDQMSSLVADSLNHHKLTGQERFSATTYGPSHITETLITEALSKVHGSDYNSMLLQIKGKNEAFANDNSDPLFERPWMQHLHLDKWNGKTGTWDNVTLDESQFPHSIPTRIVQPGNTLDSIVMDRIKQLHPESEVTPVELQGMKADTAKLNKLPSVDTPIYLGECIKLPR